MIQSDLLHSVMVFSSHSTFCAPKLCACVSVLLCAGVWCWCSCWLCEVRCCGCETKCGCCVCGGYVLFVVMSLCQCLKSCVEHLPWTQTHTQHLWTLAHKPFWTTPHTTPTAKTHHTTPHNPSYTTTTHNNTNPQSKHADKQHMHSEPTIAHLRCHWTEIPPPDCVLHANQSSTETKKKAKTRRETCVGPEGKVTWHEA